MGAATEPGRPVGFGRSADVHDLGRGRVLRRYHDRARSARYEADAMSLARAHGVPVPEVFDVDGPDIVMEKVDGPTMLADVARRPWRLLRHAAALARLHEQVHAVPAREWLQAPFGEGGALLHLDLHPENVLLSARGPVVIDWGERPGGLPRPTWPSAGWSWRCPRCPARSGSRPWGGPSSGCSPAPWSGTRG